MDELAPFFLLIASVLFAPDRYASSQHAYLINVPGINAMWTHQDEALANLVRIHREKECDPAILNSVLSLLFSKQQLEDALQKAIETSDFYRVEMLIAVTGHDLGASIQSACAYQNQSIIEILQAAHALDARDEFGRTDLYRAAVNGNLEKVKYLIDAGARVNTHKG